MGNDASQDLKYKNCVLRIWRGGSPVGTAFSIGTRVVLTCHHCAVDPSAALVLKGVVEDGDPFEAQVVEVVHAPRPASVDAAILRVDRDLPHVLPISDARRDSFGDLRAYGFPGEDRKQVAIRLDVELRGRQAFIYEKYALRDGFALAGDPATRGMSGGPVIDVGANVAVAMIVGGPDYERRTIAITLGTLDTPEDPWPAFAQAARLNRRTTMQTGWALNLPRARSLCERQVAKAASGLIKSRHFDPKQRVPRADLDRSLGRFLAGPHGTLVVTSAPNSGKTSALIGNALQIVGHSLYIDAFNVTDTKKGLLDHIQADLDDLSTPKGSEDVATLIRVLADAGEILTIHLDAVNEITDDAKRVERWLARAIGDCEELKVKLIVTCRTDYWGSLLIDNESVTRFELGNFSPEEARLAQAAYGIKETLPPDLAGHPLMFRIVASAARKGDVSVLKRQDALCDFLRILIRDAGVHGPDSIYRACERIVDDLGPEDEMIAWEHAANEVGGTATLDRLVEGGVFKTAERRFVRFSYDSVTEALRPPLSSDYGTLARLWSQALDNDRLGSRLVGSLVKSASMGRSDVAEAHVRSLVDTIADEGLLKTFLLNSGRLQATGRLVSQLYQQIPAALSSVADSVVAAFYAAVQRAAADWGDHWPESTVIPVLMAMRTPDAAKALLLKDLLATRSDFHLRTKDLFDRGHSAELLKDAEQPTRVAGALLRLTMDSPAEIRRVLLAHLDDARRLGEGGETSVGEVLASILKLTAHIDIDDLISLLLGVRGNEHAARLLREVAGLHPYKALDCVLKQMDTASAITVMDDAVASSLQSMGPGRAPPAIVDRLRAIVATATPSTGLRAAMLIRTALPDDLAAWDMIADAVASRAVNVGLLPLPAARHTAFIELLRRRRDAFAIDEMRHCDDVRSVQAPMADLACEMLAEQVYFGKELAGLAEHKAYLVERDSSLLCWLTFIQAIARHRDFRIREHLMFFAGPTSKGSKISDLECGIWGAMLEGEISDEYMERMMMHLIERGGRLDKEPLSRYVAPFFRGGQRKALSCMERVASRHAKLFALSRDMGVRSDRFDGLFRLFTRMLDLIETIGMEDDVEVHRMVGDIRATVDGFH